MCRRYESTSTGLQDMRTTSRSFTTGRQKSGKKPTENIHEALHNESPRLRHQHPEDRRWQKAFEIPIQAPQVLDRRIQQSSSKRPRQKALVRHHRRIYASCLFESSTHLSLGQWATVDDRNLWGRGRVKLHLQRRPDVGGSGNSF